MPVCSQRLLVGGESKYFFFFTSIREKRKHHLELSFFKIILSSVQTGENKTGKQVLPGTVLQNQDTLIKRGTWLSY